MTRRRTWRWIAAGALLAVAFALQARPAEAAKKIQVWVSNTNHLKCERDAEGYYVGEALGRNLAGNVTCEAFTSGGTAMASCPETFGADLHHVRIVRRSDLDMGLIDVLNDSGWPNVVWHAWGTQSPIIEAFIEPFGSCPGATIRAMSYARTF